MSREDHNLPLGFDPQRDVFIDARNLRGLTHPLRLRMLAMLRERGPATATMLAARLGESSAATSYHLRQLAEYGFVVDDETRGRGRERWWRSAHRSSYFNTTAPVDEETRLLGDAYLRAVVRGAAMRMEAWVDAQPTLPEAWRGAGTVSDYRMLLTPDEARALLERLESIGNEMRATEDDGPRPGARRVFLQFQVLPETGEIADDDDGATDG
jgi:DNA-binding transcriptional ArsR family regulator